MKLLISESAKQPRLLSYKNQRLNVAIAGLALGGAEKIVLDWARRIYPKWKVHLIVLRDHTQEWPVPKGITVTRLHNKNVIKNLRRVGKRAVMYSNSTILCHLLRKEEREALASFGATIVPVLHNAKQGWLEEGSSMSGSPYVISVSEACRNDLSQHGWKGTTSVVRHIPQVRNFMRDARNEFRKQWNIALDAKVIGMVGAVKPQKNYSLALRILK
jgi:hypothetical protein